MKQLLWRVGWCLLFGCFLPSLAHGQVASVLSSVGAVNRGAATAMPLDASNSQDWNPANITDLPVTELDLNIQPAFPHIDLNASLGPNASISQLHGGMHAVGVSDGNRFNLSPSLGFVKKLEQSPWAFGILAAATVGTGVRYPEADNPITAPPPPKGVGSGEINVRSDTIYIAPTLAYKVTKRLSIGIQPNLLIVSLDADPFPGAEPDDANADGIPTYPHTNRAWSVGAGVQGGIYYRQNNVHLGVSLKSPIWLKPFHFTTKDELGHTRHFSAKINTPMILSMGIGYSGIPRTKLAMDVRWVNYESSRRLSEAGFTHNGATKGFGWRNIWAWFFSGQYDVTQKFKLRLGYAYSLNPILPERTSFSIGSPTLITHQMSVSLAYRIRPDTIIAISYQRGFANSSKGPIQRPQGPIPDSYVKLTSSLDSIAVSLVRLFK